MTDNVPSNNNRRAALKALAAATGAAGLAALPTRWSKPAVRVGAVPAHAQVSCRDYALYIDNFVENNGSDILTAAPLVPDETNNDPRLFGWYCGGDCIYFGSFNGGGPGSGSFDVAILGLNFFTVTLAPGEEWWIAMNRATGQWDTADDFIGLDWDGIGCEPPGGPMT